MEGRSSFIKGLLKNGYFLILILLLAGIFLGGFLRAFWRDYQIRKEIQNLMAEKEKWEYSKLTLVERLKDIQSEGYIEKEARLKFGLGKEGEKLTIINRSNSPASSSSEKEARTEKMVFNSLNWWNYFFK